MASYYSAYANQYRLQLDITQVSQNIANNSSVVSWTLYLHSGQRSIDAQSIYHATVNGVSSPNENPKRIAIGMNSTVTLGSGSTTVAHNSDGTKSIAFSASFNTRSNIYYEGVLASPGSTMTISGTFALTKIPRYASITSLTASSIQRDRFTLSWTASDTISYWTYSTNVGATDQKFTDVGNPGSTSASKVITGLKPGTTYKVRIRVQRADSQLSTESSTLTVTTEAGASPNTPTITDVTRDSFKINVTANKSFNGFEYNINGGAWSAKQSGTSVPITGRTPGTTYQVRVRVYDGVDTSVRSGQSSSVNVTTLSAASPNRPTLVSKTAIQIIFNWSSNRSATNVRYKLWDSDDWRSRGADFTAQTSGTVTISGLTPGNTYHISVQVKDAVNGLWSSASASLTVPTYALSAVTGSDTTVDTGAKSFTMNKPASSFWHKVTLQMWVDDQYWMDIRSWDGTNGGGFSLTSAEVATIQNNRASSNTLLVRYKCVTRWGSGSGAVQGTTHSPEHEWTLVNVKPTLSSITYRDTHSNTDFVNWKGGDQKILRNVSPVEAKLGTATAIKGAKLSHYVFTINGVPFTVNAKSNTITETGVIANLGVINSATNQDIEVTVYDSRGNNVPMSVTVSMLDYMPPQVLSIEARRENNYERPATLVVSGRSYIVKNAAGANVNTYTATYRMKEVGTSSWSAGTPMTITKGTESGNWQNYSISHSLGEFDIDKSYDIQFVFQDSVGTQYIQNAVLTKGIGLMTFFEDKVEVGVPLYDKNSTKKYLLEGGVSWSAVTGKPSTFTPSSHSHNLLVNNTGKSLDSIAATPDSANAWNITNNTNLLLNNSNNALSIIVGGTQNNRQAMVQVGHGQHGFAGHTGELRLNPLGGLVTVNGHPITESGSNPNGRYIKFNDGTMVCHRDSFPLSYVWSQAVSETWTFPASFNSASVTVLPSFDLVTDPRRGKLTLFTRNTTTTTVEILAASDETVFSSAGETQYCKLIAIGRWK